MRYPVLLAALLFASPALAGSADSPEVTDAPGDAGPNGVAAPAGHEDVDVLAVWFEGETADTLDMVIQVGAAPRGRPNTIWGFGFTVNGTEKAAAFFEFTGFGQGGTVCDFAGGEPSNCQNVEGMAEGDKLRVRIPRANISDPAAGHDLTVTTGAVFSVYFVPAPVALPLGTTMLWDTTEGGLPYVFTKGRAAADAATGEVAGNVTGPVRGAAANVTPTGSAGAVEPNETPWPALLALAAAAAAAVALRRR